MFPLRVDVSEALITHYPDIRRMSNEAVRLGKKYVVLILTDGTRTRAHLFRASTQERIHLDWEMTIPYGSQPTFFKDLVFQEADA